MDAPELLEFLIYSSWIQTLNQDKETALISTGKFKAVSFLYFLLWQIPSFAKNSTFFLQNIFDDFIENANAIHDKMKCFEHKTEKKIVLVDDGWIDDVKQFPRQNPRNSDSGVLVPPPFEAESVKINDSINKFKEKQYKKIGLLGRCWKDHLDQRFGIRSFWFLWWMKFTWGRVDKIEMQVQYHI